jgi:hypothetical protein
MRQYWAKSSVWKNPFSKIKEEIYTSKYIDEKSISKEKKKDPDKI